MNRFLFTALALVLFCQLTFAQDKNYSKHTVAKGETITQIAAKYSVTPHDIYQLNPDSQNGIKENDVLLIPASQVKSEVVSNAKPVGAKSHVAQAKETLYSIARDYNVSIADLKVLNPELFANGLKIGQTVKIPGGSDSHASPAVESAKPVKEPVESKPSSVTYAKENVVYHIVEAKETKFGIAKKYGITVQDLEQRNPQVVSSLPVGYKLIISGKATSAPENDNRPVVEKPRPLVTEISSGDEVVTTETVRTLTKNGYANYEVKAGETMYSLSQYFKISQDELIQMNPSLKDGVKSGMILKVPGKGNVNVSGATKVSEPAKNATKTDVLPEKAVVKSESKTVPKPETKVVAKAEVTPEKPEMKKTVVANKDKKQLVLLLPFNAAKIQSDTLKTMEVRLKKDAFLNMTLDFYSGALMAIDSAKTLGLNVDVKIFDSEESKLSSNVENVIKSNNVQSADAVIGPFYQQYVEKAAELLKENNVPVISPLSKEIGQPYPNLFQSMPPTDFGKMAMFNYMLSKKGNIIVVSDPKKVYNKDFISKNYPAAKFVTLLDNGALDVNDLKAQLLKGSINYVVLDSERTGLILGTTNVLLNEMSNFQIQLVIIEPNDTLDFEEISMKRLTILKMLYPSLTRENNSVAATDFEKKYKDVNKVFPSQYAVRGFDVTFDTLLRITQGKSFIDSADEVKSEQIESKFEYAKKGTEGYVNKGVYIMEYQDDLSVKQVN